MELPSQSGLMSPTSDPGTDSDGEQMSSRVQTRKSNKPLLEKKRRARINKSLELLKGLVLEALKKDSARYSKLEKADILEMTVKHLREVQHHQMSVAMSVDPSVAGKFKNGFNECAQEVNRYLGTIDGLSPEVRMRLMQHLGNCANQSRQVGLPSMSMFGVPAASPPHALPGMSMRCGLPFGGLAFPSPESPTLPVSQATVYTPNEYRMNNAQFTPKIDSRVSMTVRHDNRENIAPLRCQRPLMERSTNSENTGPRLARRNDRNNNTHMEAPPTKRQKMEVKSEPQVPQDYVTIKHINNLCQEHINNGIGHNLYDMNIKMEPVWRPW